MVLHQFDYIFAIGLIFAFLDAWNIGANDVANSFATSVSSRSLTMMQAMMIATVMEFGGAVLVGSRVSDTVRNGIISTSKFTKEPAVLMLGMMCALVGSSLWLTFATKMGMPVSTTHSIVGAIIGVGIATLGADGIQWAYNDGKGVAGIVSAWFIAPAIAGGFAIIIFLITKYGVLERKRPLRAGFMMVPFYFAITAGVLTMVIVFKGAPSLNLDELSTGQTLGAIFGVAGGVVVLYGVFFLPFLYRKLELEDWQLRTWEIIYGPLLWKRGPVPPRPEGAAVVKDYYSGHKTKEELSTARGAAGDVENAVQTDAQGSEDGIKRDTSSTEKNGEQTLAAHEEASLGPWYTPRNLFAKAKYYFFRGVDRDVVSEQKSGDDATGFLAGDLDKMHAEVKHYDNKTEHLYSFLQVLTAATASFAHGSNDVSNAIGPLTTIYLVWNTNTIAKKADVPIWILVFGGAAITIGLWTYGYNMMRQLGNRLTLHSPSRGFSMELGAAITVILASQFGLPISTTQCITGATVGVGFCSGTWRAVNWRMIAWIYLGWIITLPVAGIISGCLMGVIINAPKWSGIA
ncbi:phosphate-repressible phosphate permease [Nannizzia gypsea CBS 118893]|uniref:Phosphate transporter n=1 Tax=Arthroderma gypseum (strain ATCC MYA-4604 / CBS 118893) TaxID=535722 RepID=E4USB1_ARTGP|nr:phosphate-repressible phosphate permease [Nannizzia gypsea CBS 118893]EFR01315.1 phosphate-repressible phosphate permease [Nannizzia gypsea CBS 118893]